MFLGAPGAGKGTQAENVSAKLSIPAISTGNILREAVKAGSELGARAKGFMDSGALVPDETVIGILKERIAAPDCENGFILDGFPRTVAQAEALDAMDVMIDTVVSIEVSDERIVARMGGRRSCPGCGATYHIVYKPSETGETCGKCGAALIIRRDDEPEVVSSRLHTYHEQTEPLLGYYAQKGILKTVEGQEEVADTTRLTMEALGLK